MPDELVPGVPYPTGSIHPYFLNCSGKTDSAGGGCGLGFAPNMNITLPSEGLPEINLTLPNFSGLTIEGIIKALEMIGIDPCKFIDAVAGEALAMMDEMQSAIQGSIDGVLGAPQQIANEISSQAQAGIDGMAENSGANDLLAFLEDPCTGLVGSANQTFGEMADLESTMTGLQSQVSSLSSDLSSLQNQVNNLPTPTP